MGKEVIRPKLCFQLPQGKRGFQKDKLCFVETSEQGVRCCSEHRSEHPQLPGAASDRASDPHHALAAG